MKNISIHHLLTRRQSEIHDFLKTHMDDFEHPPTLQELCDAMGLTSRGSMHLQIKALIDAGLVEPMNQQHRGIRLTTQPPATAEDLDELPFHGAIAAGQPIEAIPGPETMLIPPAIRTERPCYVLQIKGDSMIEAGILDGDWVVIEQRDHAKNGEIVVALIDRDEATLKEIEQTPERIILHPRNPALDPMTYFPEQVRIQGVLVGQMRRYQ